MIYLNVLKEQSACIDQEIEELTRQLSSPSNSGKGDIVSLQRYYSQMEDIHKEIQMLLQTTRANATLQEKLQAKRKAVIDAVLAYTESIAETCGVTFSPNKCVLNENERQDDSLQTNGSKNESKYLDECSDDEDISTLLSKSLPKL